MVPEDLNAPLSKQLAGDLPLAHDPQAIVAEMVRRDQARIRILAWLCLILWLGATAGMLLLIVGLNELVIFIRVSYYRMLYPNASRPYNADEQLRIMLDGTTLIHHSIPYVAAAVVALMLAGLIMVWLVISTRRATLNRISLSLMQLSEQVSQLRQH